MAMLFTDILIEPEMRLITKDNFTIEQWIAANLNRPALVDE